MVSIKNNHLLPSTSRRSDYTTIVASHDDENSLISPDHNSRCSYYRTPLTLATIGVAIGLLSFVHTLVHDESFHLRFLAGELPLLGKSKKKKKSKKHEARNECEKDKSYSKHTLKSAYDLPYAALFRDTRGQSKFEASDVTIVNNTVYSVCDSSWSISKFTRDLIPFSNKNVQIGDPNREEDEESGYEAIFEHQGLFYVVRESVYHADHGGDNEEGEESKDESSMGDYHAIIEELQLGEDDYNLVRECQCEFTFEGYSKGFEGAVGFSDKDGTLYIVGLCEGNHCSEAKKNDVGNGRVVLMRKREGEEKENKCLWETVRVVHIPESAAFLDYSAIDITADGRVAIASQEHSSVWLGHAFGVSNGIIDPEEFEFDDHSNSVLQFPKDGGCHTIYCNVEGLHFINDEMLIAVSDKMKSRGRQDFRCHEKDQSIHAFVIP